MEIIKVPIGELTPDPDNAKDHPAWQIEQIKNSIEQFGNLDPIGVWGENNLVVEGNGRLEALKELGYTEAECIRLDWLTEEERRAYALAHNKLTMNSGFIPEALDTNLAAVGEIDMSLFGFNWDADWFSSGDKGEAREGEDEYSDFLDKFKQKHTSDDCYTPEGVYNAVADWVAKEYGLDRKNFVRPFYPGGDYQNEKYKKTDVVVDNPPFSIMKEIIDFYVANKIRFFLFAPCMALFNYLNNAYDVTGIAVQASVEYKNKAIVPTSFLTNLDKANRARTAPDLYQNIKEAVDKIHAETTREIPKYSYPDEVVTAAMLGKYSHYGIDYKIAKKDCTQVRQLDAQKETDKVIYGGGLLLSEKAAAEKAAAEKAAAEKAAAEKAAAEKAAATKWELSDREKEIVKSLG